ncbi:hypothetical protein RVV74_003070 [Enterobacter ludwigii]|nr:hypothetical protein [Enterobacter ludwigii]
MTYNPQTDAMNPRQLYKQIIWWAQIHPVASGCYGENHHVIQRAIFQRSNRLYLEALTVRVTARHHYTAHRFYARWKQTAPAWQAVYAMMLDKRYRKGRGRQDITDGVTPDMYNLAKEQAMTLRSADPVWIEHNRKGLVKRQANVHADKVAAAQKLRWLRKGERERMRGILQASMTAETLARREATMREKYHSDPEWTAKRMAKVNDAWGRPLITIRLSDGYQQYWPLVADANRAFGVQNGKFTMVANGKRRSAGGYGARYATPEEIAVGKPLSIVEVRKVKTKSRPVIRIANDGTETLFDTVPVAVAATPGASSSKICLVCKGKRETNAGYRWRYSE